MKKLIAAALLGILSISPIIAQEKSKPNVLFIAVDDLKQFWVVMEIKLLKRQTLTDWQKWVRFF